MHSEALYKISNINIVKSICQIIADSIKQHDELEKLLITASHLHKNQGIYS